MDAAARPTCSSSPPDANRSSPFRIRRAPRTPHLPCGTGSSRSRAGSRGMASYGRSSPGRLATLGRCPRSPMGPCRVNAPSRAARATSATAKCKRSRSTERSSRSYGSRRSRSFRCTPNGNTGSTRFRAGTGRASAEPARASRARRRRSHPWKRNIPACLSCSGRRRTSLAFSVAIAISATAHACSSHAPGHASKRP